VTLRGLLRERAAAAGRKARAVYCQVYGDLRPELVDRLVASGVDRIDLAVAHGPPGPMVDEIGRLGETIAPFRG